MLRPLVLAACCLNWTYTRWPLADHVLVLSLSLWLPVCSRWSASRQSIAGSCDCSCCCWLPMRAGTPSASVLRLNCSLMRFREMPSDVVLFEYKVLHTVGAIRDLPRAYSRTVADNLRLSVTNSRPVTAPLTEWPHGENIFSVLTLISTSGLLMADSRLLDRCSGVRHVHAGSRPVQLKQDPGPSLPWPATDSLRHRARQQSYGWPPPSPNQPPAPYNSHAPFALRAGTRERWTRSWKSITGPGEFAAASSRRRAGVVQRRIADQRTDESPDKNNITARTHARTQLAACLLMPCSMRFNLHCKTAKAYRLGGSE